MMHPQQRCPGCCVDDAAAEDAAAGTQMDPKLLGPRVVYGPFLSRDRECQAQTGRYSHPWLFRLCLCGDTVSVCKYTVVQRSCGGWWAQVGTGPCTLVYVQLWTCVAVRI